MQPSKQSDTTFEEINQLVWEHLEARDWTGNSPRSYATSIALEAAELLEHYQWSDHAVGDKQALASELADILIYCFEFAQSTDIDIADAIKNKLAYVNKKYPAASFKGKSEADRHHNLLKARESHRAPKKGL